MVFSVNDKGDKSVKNVTSRRLIPVHRMILKYGFKAYLQHLTDINETKVFPHLTPDSFGVPTKKFSRFWNGKYKTKAGFMDYCGIEKDGAEGKKVFHSFRHTFINQAKQQRLDTQILKELVGHAKSDMTLDRYSKEYDIKTKQKEINKIKFAIEKENLPVVWQKRFY